MISRVSFAATVALILLCSSVVRADVPGFFYEWTDRILHLSGCPGVSPQEAKMIDCPKPGGFHSLDAAVTERFFDLGAANQLKELQCGVTTMKEWGTKGSAVPQLLAQDLSDKIDSLRTLSQEIRRLNADIINKRMTLLSRGGEGAMVPKGNFELYKRKVPPLEKELEDLSRQYAAAIASTPLHEFPEGADLLDRAIHGGKSVSANDVSAAVQKQLASYEKNRKKLQSMKRGAEEFDLDRPTREWLFENGDPSSWLDPEDRKSASAHNLMCRMDARYGRGVHETKNVLTYGSFLLWGAGLAMKLSAAGKLAVWGIQAAERGALYSAAAEILVVGSTPMLFPGAASAVHKQCLSNKPRVALHGACEDRSEKSVRFSVEQGNCALALAMAAYTTASGGAMIPAVRTRLSATGSKLLERWKVFRAE